MAHVLVGGKKREDVLNNEKNRLEKLKQSEESDERSSTDNPSGVFSPVDTFSIGDIVKNEQGDFDFLELETIEGIWHKMTLRSRRFTQQSEPLLRITRSDAIAISGRNDQEYHLTPLKARYWMMRAAVELLEHKSTLDNTRLRRDIAEVLDLFRQDGMAPYHHNAETLNHKNSITFLYVHGWPTGHPFNTKYPIPDAPSPSCTIEPGQDLEYTLYALLEDADPKHVAYVLNQALLLPPIPNDPTPPNRVKIPHLGMNTLSSTNDFVVTVGYTPQGQVSVFTIEDNGENRSARGLRADVKDYTPHLPRRGG